jgi:hypothetical protein
MEAFDNYIIICLDYQHNWPAPNKFTLMFQNVTTTSVSSFEVRLYLASN